MHDVDRLLYVDTDVLFLRPVEDIWDFFHQFNSTHIAALAWEHEEGTAAWYSRFARHPYYPPHGKYVFTLYTGHFLSKNDTK